MKQQHTLYQLRTAKGWRREQLASELGVSLTTVVNLEGGKHQPRMPLARRIAALFNVSMDSIEWGVADGPKARDA